MRLKLRRKINPIKARITIDVMVLRATDSVHIWLKNWKEIIDAMHPLNRPVGFGQSSCWEAFVRAEKDGLKALKLPLKYGLPGRNKPDDVIWCGNVHKLKKDDCAIMFRKEFEQKG